jgi:hypothetical protein
MPERGWAARWWRNCGGCGMQRKLAALEPEQMIGHRRWDAQRHAMVPCEGGGKPPAVGPAPVVFSPAVAS